MEINLQIKSVIQFAQRFLHKQWSIIHIYLLAVPEGKLKFGPKL